jgi:hypothetical protein
MLGASQLLHMDIGMGCLRLSSETKHFAQVEVLELGVRRQHFAA